MTDSEIVLSLISSFSIGGVSALLLRILISRW